jgi:NADPH-dependent glutamate synthase beta subunit-like oxidoreductase
MKEWEKLTPGGLILEAGSSMKYKTGDWRSQKPILDRTEVARCNYFCPAGENILEYLLLAGEGRYADAWRLIVEDNPLPGICGRVCPHPCETDCNRKDFGGVITVHLVERFLSDRAARDAYKLPPPKEKKSKRIAVVGSGPAGLSCAYHLARMGYPVTIFDANDKLGGMMRLIPSYRLPRDVLDREIKNIENQGVKIETKKKLGDTLTWNELKSFDAIFLGVGQSQSMRLKIPGEESDMVWPGIEFLARIDRGERPAIGKKVCVIGGGNTAMDAARTARRLGSDVTILYRRTREEMPANDEEIEEALDEGIKIEYLVAPIEIRTQNGLVVEIRLQRMQLGEPDKSGRRRPVPISGSEFTMPCDTVIPALGQSADLKFLGETIKHESSRIFINEADQTSDQKVFAGGDVATGFGTVTHAVGSGKRAALAIDRYLRNVPLGEFPALERNVTSQKRDVNSLVVKATEDLNVYCVEESTRPMQIQIPPGTRIKSFNEVNQGLTEDAILKEARRCFTCGTCKDCLVCYICCPDSSVKVKKGRVEEINLEYCKGCGICAFMCPTKSIHMEQEG